MQEIDITNFLKMNLFSLQYLQVYVRYLTYLNQNTFLVYPIGTQISIIFKGKK